MGISIRAYARGRGVSDAAVRKAIKTGRITPEPDGTIEPARADREWRRNTDSAQQRGRQRAVPNEAIAAVREAVGEPPLGGGTESGGTTFLQARTANEVLKAQTNKVRLARLKGELVDRAQAIGHVFTLARAERDAWLNWPSRISAQISAELRVDPHALHVMLEREVRRHLEELGSFQPRVD
ncbi:MAG: elements of external origin [Gammaproteobacteria bacterium]